MKYNPALDGIRAFAALSVLLFHCLVPHLDGGYLGVDLFFVLSGYLITTLLLREHEAGGVRLGAFYLRRVGRLYPALVGMVALYLALFGFDWKSALVILTYTADYYQAFVGLPVAVEHTWSLAVEEHFYLLWPLLLPFVARSRKRAVYLMAAVFIAGTFWRFYVDEYADLSNAAWRFDTRLTGLALGCLIAFLPPIRIPWWLPAILLGALAAYWWIPPGFILPVKMGLSLTLFELCSACVVLWGATNPAPLRWGPLPYIGRISYGLYLYHYPVAVFIYQYTHDWRVIASGTLVATFALAALSFRYVEKPIRSAIGERSRRHAEGRAVGIATDALGDAEVV